MTVQISDSTGQNWRQIVTTGTGNPLKATLPSDLIPDKQYHLHVVATDGGTASGAYEYPLTAGKKTRAKFASQSVIYDGKTTGNLFFQFMCVLAEHERNVIRERTKAGLEKPVRGADPEGGRKG